MWPYSMLVSASSHPLKNYPTALSQDSAVNSQQVAIPSEGMEWGEETESEEDSLKDSPPQKTTKHSV